MIRLVVVISSLQRGGAETQLALLIRNLDHSRFHVTIVTIYEPGELARELEGVENVQVISLAKRSGLDDILSWLRLARLVRSLRPDVVHGYLDSSNVRALVAGKWSSARVIWGVRSSNMEVVPMDRTSHVYRRLARLLSRFADLIISNSVAGQKFAVHHGYPSHLVTIIPNGFDTTRFTPDREARLRQRQAWGIEATTPVIGLVARLDPVKDHATFLEGAALLIQAYPNARFVCVGGGNESYRSAVRDLSHSLGLDDYVSWVGEHSDMPSVYNALDVVVSTSISEGFSNSLGEAMACGVPCVATDVGDARAILGDTGAVVPSGNPEALAASLGSFLAQPPAELRAMGDSAREWIVSQYSVKRLVERTTSAMEKLLSPG